MAGVITDVKRINSLTLHLLLSRPIRIELRSANQFSLLILKAGSCLELIVIRLF